MHVLHVITGLQKAAGTSTFCGEVCNQLAALGHDVTIAVCNPEQPNHYPLDPRIHLVSIESILHSSTSTSNFNLIHIHALWSPILHKVANWARQNHIPVVWSPHGMITPWAMRNKWWKKWLGWWLYQKRDLQSVALLHATAQSEVEDIRRMGLKNKVVVAPLGVRINEKRVMRNEKLRNGKTLLFVSRVQRKKGLPMLLDAWAMIKEEGRRKKGEDLTKGWMIRIVGPDQDGHTAELMTQCERLGLTYVQAKVGMENRSTVDGPFSKSNNQTIKQSNNVDVEFIGPKYGDDLTHEYASADLFVLPTHSENFGSVVIESLAQGVPVICTKGAPWEELTTHCCGWWIDIGVEPLADALRTALNLPREELEKMGRRGRALVEEKYTWKAVAKAVEEAYDDARYGCEFAPCGACEKCYDTCSPERIIR